MVNQCYPVIYELVIGQVARFVVRSASPQKGRNPFGRSNSQFELESGSGF